MSDRVSPPRQLILHKVSRTLELVFAAQLPVQLPAAWLRAESPAADNRRATLTPGQFDAVSILSIEPVGHYAVKLLFSDGHRSGIYSWETLHALAERYQKQQEK